MSELKRTVFKKYTPRELPKRRHLCAVASPVPGSGVSMTAGTLAWFSKNDAGVSLIEAGRPHFYSALGIDRRFQAGEFVFYEKALSDFKSIRNAENRIFDINWLLRHPKDKDMPSEAELIRLTAFAPGELCIFDCSGLFGPLLEGFLSEMDTVILVVDPLPSKLIEGAPAFDRLRLLFPKAVIAVNCMNRGVHRQELTRYLGLREPVFTEAVPMELIYSAEYACRPVWELSEAEKLLQKPAMELLSKMGFTSGQKLSP